MWLRCTLLISFCFTLISNITASDQLYVKLADDVISSFDKKLLPQMKTLFEMKQDWPEAGETLNAPFPLPNITFDEFNEFITRIFSIDYEKEHDHLFVGFQNNIWHSLESDPHRYTVLAQLLKVANYLNVSSKIFTLLEECIFTLPRNKVLRPVVGSFFSLNPEERVALQKNLHDINEFVSETVDSTSLDAALKSGLQDINMLVTEILIPIKEKILEQMIRSIQNYITKQEPKKTFSIFIENNGFPNPYNIPNRVVDNVLYRGNKLRTDCFLNGAAALFVCGDGKIPMQFINLYSIRHNNINFERINIATMIPPIKLAQTSHQEILAERIPSYASMGVFPDFDVFGPQSVPQVLLNVGTSSNGNYITAVFYEPSERIGFSFIGNRVLKKRMQLPDIVSKIDTFVDKQGNEMVICISGSIVTNNKLLVINPSLSTLKIMPLQLQYVSSWFIVKNLLIWTEVNNGQTDLYYCDLYDPQLTKLLLTRVDNKTYINAIIMHDDNFYLHSYQNLLDLYFNTSTAGVYGGIGLSLPFQKHRLNVGRFQFNTLVYPVDVEQGQGWQILERKNGAAETAMYDANSNTIIIRELVSKKQVDALNNIQHLTDLSIEQLYALGEIVERVTSKNFKSMTPIEKKLFESMNLKAQNIFHDLLSADKPINIEGPRAIVNPTKAGTVETPLKKYIQDQSKKRAASEEAEGKKPSKRRRTKKTDSGSESDDETTLDESHDA